VLALWPARSVRLGIEVLCGVGRKLRDEVVGLQGYANCAHTYIRGDNFIVIGKPESLVTWLPVTCIPR
jgi:hypothetical protein